MQAGSLVVCIEGHPGFLEEGQIYTVHSLEDHEKSGTTGVWLYEAAPPYPCKGFAIRRFVEIQEPLDVNSLIQDVLYESKD
jgi:hypothetical protein